MALAERQRLLLAYRGAVQAYHEAVEALDENRFHESLHLAELARNRAETARTALLHHEHRHAASTGAMPKEPAHITIIGSTVSLFDLGTGHWEVFELTTTGEPPSASLAYANGNWITDAAEMNDRQNEKLYFTEAGLAILREAGLEM